MNATPRHMYLHLVGHTRPLRVFVPHVNGGFLRADAIGMYANPVAGSTRVPFAQFTLVDGTVQAININRVERVEMCMEWREWETYYDEERGKDELRENPVDSRREADGLAAAGCRIEVSYDGGKNWYPYPDTPKGNPSHA